MDTCGGGRSEDEGSRGLFVLPVEKVGEGGFFVLRVEKVEDGEGSSFFGPRRWKNPPHLRRTSSSHLRRSPTPSPLCSIRSSINFSEPQIVEKGFFGLRLRRSYVDGRSSPIFGAGRSKNPPHLRRRTLHLRSRPSSSSKKTRPILEEHPRPSSKNTPAHLRRTPRYLRGAPSSSFFDPEDRRIPPLSIFGTEDWVEDRHRPRGGKGFTETFRPVHWSATRNEERPLARGSTAGFCSPIGLQRNSCGRACRDTPRMVFFGCLEGKKGGRILVEPTRRRPVVLVPAPPCPDPPVVCPTRERLHTSLNCIIFLGHSLHEKDLHLSRPKPGPTAGESGRGGARRGSGARRGRAGRDADGSVRTEYHRPS